MCTPWTQSVLWLDFSLNKLFIYTYCSITPQLWVIFTCMFEDVINFSRMTEGRWIALSRKLQDMGHAYSKVWAMLIIAQVMTSICHTLTQYWIIIWAGDSLAKTSLLWLACLRWTHGYWSRAKKAIICIWAITIALFVKSKFISTKFNI